MNWRRKDRRTDGRMDGGTCGKNLKSLSRPALLGSSKYEEFNYLATEEEFIRNNINNHKQKYQHFGID